MNTIVPKGYKKTKVGVIPEDWEVVKLGDIFNIKVGKDLDENNFSPLKTAEHIYPIYSNTVEQRGLYGYSKVYEYNKNSLTVVGRGIGLGTAFSRHHDYSAIGRLLVLQPINKTDVDFMSEYINFKMHIFDESSGIPQLTGISFSTYLVLLPSLKEQEKIAEILTTWDEAIIKQEELIKAKELQKKGLMQKLLSGEVRFREFTSSWKKTKIGSVCTIKTGISKSEFRSNDGKFFIVDMGSVSKYGELIATKKTNIQQDILSKDDLIMPKDDIGGGEIIGKTARIDCDNKYVLGDHVFLLRCKKDNPVFIHYVINSHAINKSLRRKSTGTAQLGLSKKSVETQTIFCPDIQEQQKIAEVLSLADDEISLLQNELAELKQQKKGLMQKLLTGKVRVKV